MRLFNFAVVLMGLIFSGYYVFLAFNSSEIFVSILRGVGAIVWLFLTIIIFKEKDVTPKERVKKWFINEKPKGLFRYMLLKGVFGWGLFVGFTTWLVSDEIETTQNLLLSFSKHLAIYIVMGFFMGWFMWSTNEEKANKIGLKDM